MERHGRLQSVSDIAVGTAVIGPIAQVQIVQLLPEHLLLHGYQRRLLPLAVA